MHANSRRQFFRKVAAAASVAAIGRDDLHARVRRAGQAAAGRSPEAVAADEDY
jgi:hypothetical protein